jgi:hypothetical protein
MIGLTLLQATFKRLGRLCSDSDIKTRCAWLRLQSAAMTAPVYAQLVAGVMGYKFSQKTKE